MPIYRKKKKLPFSQHIVLGVPSFPVCLIIHVCIPTMHTHYAHYHPHLSPFSCHTHLYFSSDTCLNTHPNPVELKHIQLFVQHKHIPLLYHMSYNTPTHYHHLSPHLCHLFTHCTSTYAHTQDTNDLHSRSHYVTWHHSLPLPSSSHPKQYTPLPHSFSVPASTFEL